MIFCRLFFVFLRIGLFSFGGGLAMISLIQHEVVDEQGWLTTREFTDIVATSQVTPVLRKATSLSASPAAAAEPTRHAAVTATVSFRAQMTQLQRPAKQSR